MYDELIKNDLETAIRNTHKQMLEKHPDQKKLLDIMLELRLKKIGRVP